jgi:multiple sugar transport system permease protein
MIREEIPMEYALHMASATFAAIPMLVVFFAFQKYFLKGITVGAIK